MALTFRARLTLQYIAMLSCLLALTAAGLLFALNRVAEKKFDAALWMVGAAEAENAAANVHQRGIERPDASTVSNTRYREVLGYENGALEKYVTIVDDLRRVADTTENLNAPLPLDDKLLARCFAGETVYQTTRVDGMKALRVVYMPVRGSSVPRPFAVIVGLPESFVGSEMRSFRIAVALALCTLLLLTAASAMLLADRAIKPIEEIAAAAESITAPNLQARLPEPRTQDQIGRLTNVFNQMLARLDVAFAAQRRFTSRAAHELRTPLTILKGETQVALRRRRTIEEYEQLLTSNLEEIEKLTLTIDDLLLLARYEGGETEIPRESVRLDEIVMNAAAPLQSIAAAKGIELRIETPQPVIVNGEPKAIVRLAHNLLENALHYTPQGGRVTARVGRDDETRRGEFCVEDTGIGIEAKDLPHIFQRFYRSDAARQMRAEGSGIGLSTSAAIARLHYAAINVSSEPNAGTRFVVSFPPDDSNSIQAINL